MKGVSAIMKKNILLCGLIFLLLLICVSCDRIPKIEFAQADTDFSQDFDQLVNSLTTENMAIFEQEYPVYKVVKPKLDRKYMEKIRDLFEIPQDSARSTDLYEGYSEQNKTLNFQSNTFFYYSYTPHGYESTPVTTDDETLVKQATEFLQEHNLLPDDFSYSGMGQSTLQSGAGDPLVYEKIVGFSRTIDGHPVIGNSHIHIGFYQNAISSLSVAYNEYKEKKTVASASYDEAIAQLKDPDIIFEYDSEVITEKLDTVELLEAEVVYVDHAYDNKAKYIQPAYRLKGTISDVGGHTSDFSAVVRAVAE